MDSFPLPRIDQIVNATIRHGMLSFIDAFYGYHQISMFQLDKDKTTFMTPHKLYYYKVMSFMLKNIGATYQRLMTKIFKSLIDQTVEVYIDDIVVKSKNQRASVTGLTDECKREFNKVKCYLTHPPILNSPQSGEQLYIYLAMFDCAVSIVLFRHVKDKEQRLVYYVSKTIVDVETWYSKMEETTLALKNVAQNLRPYFQAHQPRLALKGQVMADFIVEFPQKPPHLAYSPEEGWWVLHVDGTSRASSSRPTIRKDIKSYVRRCDQCQKYVPIPHMPSEVLNPVMSPWPFTLWGMDIVSPLPIASAQKKFLLVATDYFSKWVEVEAYASIKDKDISKFIWKNIVCRFEILQALVADNGPQFNSIAFRTFYSELKIKNLYSTPRYP
ncbi:Transposon Ty3-I Gag-Pol polyprotein [Vitis vinifera]|uniref:Transposon Ty3-I Gag-Pol polyprotein n=1 Tax=Vitis vinifera TaxID=29760 RepID=A0A438ILH2_VITVI|nr:Transposon Ty3-I Gag-Pol polyprotein [Vitis vinifera]